MSSITLGSLFDGSGGFPLAGKKHGITPVWASEIEPFPIRVTRKRLPEMKHIGDITKLNGGEIEPVDIITGGSPCQSWSVIGSREGLAGKSGLFNEMIRVIQEMREATKGQSPTWVVFENVPGMTNCHEGDDFNFVLNEFRRLGGSIAECTRPKKWQLRGSIMEDNFSLAWRVLDAQYFGTPQQRRRVFIILYFGESHNVGGANSILFERKVSKGDSEKSLQERAQLASSAGGDCTETDTRAISVEYQPTDSRIKLRKDDTVQTLCSRMGTGGNTTPLVLENVPIALSRSDFFTRPLWDLMQPLMATDSKEAPIVLTYESSMGGGSLPFLRRITPLECARLQGFPDDWCDALVDENPTDEEVSFWQDVWDCWNDSRGVKRKTEKQIRKWLATEPTDAAKYKMYGNGVALPCVEFILERIAKTAFM